MTQQIKSTHEASADTKPLSEISQPPVDGPKCKLSLDLEVSLNAPEIASESGQKPEIGDNGLAEEPGERHYDLIRRAEMIDRVE